MGTEVYEYNVLIFKWPTDLNNLDQLAPRVVLETSFTVIKLLVEVCLSWISWHLLNLVLQWQANWNWLNYLAYLSTTNAGVFLFSLHLWFMFVNLNVVLDWKNKISSHFPTPPPQKNGLLCTCLLPNGPISQNTFTELFLHLSLKSYVWKMFSNINVSLWIKGKYFSCTLDFAN